MARLSHNLNRRRFLFVSAAGAAAAITAACSPALPTPTPAPVAKPAAPAAAATTAPAAAATAAPAAKPAAAAPTQAPAVAAKPAAEPKLGSQLIGKLEGPEIVTDSSRVPRAFKEAPQLAALVKEGKLPPVQDRIGADPLVIKPVQQTGKYGGTWRRGFTGPADDQNGHRVAGGDRLLFWDATKYPKMVPNVAAGWKVDEGGRLFTISLRKGARWSDGQPFTVDDIMFWYEDVYKNPDLNPTKSSYLSINGKEGKIVKVDDLTVRFEFPDPYPLFLEILGSSINVFAGPAIQGKNGLGGYLPKHYLKQFHPKHVSQADLDKRVQDAKVDNWVNLFKLRASWHVNPDLPVMTPWKTTTPANTPTWTLDRNPYYFGVDTDGNQLPYIDKIVMTLAENLEVLNLRAIAGEYDMQARHLDIAKLPLFLQNQQKGDYKLSIDPAQHGADGAFRINLSYDKDPEIAKWLTNRDFRRALSLGINRDQINETIFLGIGTPGSAVASEDNPFNPGPEYRKLWSTHDPKQANEMLDKIGLDKKDSEGYRLRTDNSGRLRIEVSTIGAAFIQFTKIAEMVREHWKAIGIQADIAEQERSLSTRRIEANETQIHVWQNDGSDELYLYPQNQFPFVTGSSVGPEFAKWFSSGGKQGREPADPNIKKAWDMFVRGPGLSEEERIRLGKEIWKIAIDDVWVIGTVGLSGAFMGVRVTSNKMGNVPGRHLNLQAGQTPNISRPATFYFK
jgi:peptide/nickel transport system substrate-binding protein